jgi:hypothetical protein
MVKMKKKLFFLVVLTIVISISSVVYAKKLNQPTSGPSVSHTEHDANSLSKNMGINIDDVLSNQLLPTPQLTQDQVIQIAKQMYPNYVNTATSIKAEFHLMSDPNFNFFSKEALDKNPTLKANGHMNKTPVYIVSFDGLKISGNVAFSSTTTKTYHHEWNVVIDALTGEALTEFSYR